MVCGIPTLWQDEKRWTGRFDLSLRKNIFYIFAPEQDNHASALVHVADRVIHLGLAPEIPEDLYMLIKKVRHHDYGNSRAVLTWLARLLPSESTLSETERTRTPSSD